MLQNSVATLPHQGTARLDRQTTTCSTMLIYPARTTAELPRHVRFHASPRRCHARPAAERAEPRHADSQQVTR